MVVSSSWAIAVVYLRLLIMGPVDFPELVSLKFETVSSGRSYRGRTYIVPVNWRHSFSAAARRLSI